MLHWKNKMTTGTVLKKSQYTLSILIPIKKKKKKYAFKWYFYGFLYNTTFSENIHLDINSSTNVQNLKLILFSLIIIHF